MDKNEKYTKTHLEAFLKEMEAKIDEDERRLSLYREDDYALFHVKMEGILEYIVKNRTDLTFSSSEYDIHHGERLWDIEGVHLEELEDLCRLLVEVYPETSYKGLSDDDTMFLQVRHIFAWKKYQVAYALYYGQGEFIHEISMKKDDHIKPFRPTRVQCRLCKDVIYSPVPGRYVSCGCEAVSIDETRHYIRLMGERENYEIMEEK